jgi:hypothetical protein
MLRLASSPGTTRCCCRPSSSASSRARARSRRTEASARSGAPPDRWVIDLSKEEDVLLPQHYHAIPFPENRLFVPAEFVPLFLEHGWRRGADGR